MEQYTGKGKTIDEAMVDAASKAMAELVQMILDFKVEEIKGQIGGFVGYRQIEVVICASKIAG